MSNLRTIYQAGHPRDDVTELLQPEEILAVHVIQASKGAYRSGRVLRWMVADIMDTNWSAMHAAFREYRADRLES